MKAALRFAVPLVVALMFPALAAAQASLYRWVDKDGKVHYSDTPPAETAKSVTQKRFGGGQSGDGSQLPYATQVAMKRSPVTLFVTKDCGDPCAQARDILVRRGIPHAERDVQGNADAAAALRTLVGSLYVPVMTLGSVTLKGFEESSWQAALDGAGYPRTALPSQLRTRPTAPLPTTPATSEPAPPATSGENPQDAPGSPALPPGENPPKPKE